HLRELGVTQHQVTVILPAPANEAFLARVRRMRAWAGLAESLRELPNVGVVIVRAHSDTADPAHPHRVQLSPRRRHVALILVEDQATEVTLILPRRHFPKRRHLLLHDRTSRGIAGAFAEEPHVDVVVVPYHLGADRTSAPEAELATR